VAALTKNDAPRPIIVNDLDHDGDLDVYCVGWNLVLKNEGKGEFSISQLLDKPVTHPTSALLADFDGDGKADLMVLGEKQKPRIYKGRGVGAFAETPSEVELDPEQLKLPYVLTAGDIDGDRDLDVWLAQYRKPYEYGTMPKPYYDANDAWPSYLLINDGKGKFSDGTAKAGLDKKRGRRTYSASFVDLDDDLDLDLMVVSHFAGVDLYQNDGKGNFEDVTKKLSHTKLFGMAHSFSDFDRDGHLDFFTLGMGSTTARRLVKMGLARDDKTEHNSMRLPMGYGNRLYLYRDGNYVQPNFNDTVARTGWSWGFATEDFDRDGFEDLYVANGNASGKSTSDYCTNFWRHDIYVDTKEYNKDLAYRFLERLRPVQDGDTSWNGYEHKPLLMNRGGKSFVNLGYLFGIAFEFDGRAVAGDDLDQDGRPDILITSKSNLGLDKFGVHFVRNAWKTDNHWIGVRLPELAYSALGAKITVTAGSKKYVHQFVTGDSHQSQHSFSKVFGLGSESSVDAIEVRWPTGVSGTLEKPSIDRYHDLAVEPAMLLANIPTAAPAAVTDGDPKGASESSSRPLWGLLVVVALLAAGALVMLKRKDR
jgi:hypothetical protein